MDKLSINLKRAVLTGALLWVLIFFEVSILMFGFKLSAPSMKYYMIHFILLAVLTVLCAYFYFKNAETGAKQGLIAGIVFLVVGIVLDAIITVPLFIKDYSFFIQPGMLIGYSLGVVLVTIVGTVKKKYLTPI